MRQRVKIVIKEEIVRELYAIAGEDAVQTAEPMKNHTTFRVGGPADYFVAPHTEEEIRKIVALCEEKEIPWFVTGNGSNLVVSDEGYHGVILSVYKNFQGIEVEGNRIRAKAGSMLVSISKSGGISTFRSSVVVEKSAKKAKSSVSCQSLMLDSESRSDTIPAMDIRTKDAAVGHEAKIGSISGDAIFYLMSRGMTEEDARALIVSGFADNVSKELPLEYAVEMNNLIRLEMKGSIG